MIRPSAGERENFLCSLFVRNSIPSGGALVNRRIAAELGGFDTRMVFAEDHAFWISLARRGEPAYVPEVVCIHRRHGGNRWSPAISPIDERLIDVLAETDERLGPCLPRRRGVQLCEVSIDARVREQVAEVQVGGSTGYWFSGAEHLFFYADATGQFRSDQLRLSGDTLVFERNGVIVRIEGARDQADALRLAALIN